ncbi:MAG TPA: hypothetical protein VE944_33260 [Nostoc sp.]|uniref:hypothetical protein n=1 Tax=Nostoc sp. TaxID=1180 RepID=UPI002D66B5E6|nr:hypothetical protein [Nostoc sp.]HYX19138.1 hypothetical protein [Nostoc sp.]
MNFRKLKAGIATLALLELFLLSSPFIKVAGASLPTSQAFRQVKLKKLSTEREKILSSAKINNKKILLSRTQSLNWSGWSEVSGNGITNLADTATFYNNKLYLFGIGTDDRHYVNVYDSNGWSGWSEVPGNGITKLSDTATVYNNKLYLFGIGTDGRHYVNVGQ